METVDSLRLCTSPNLGKKVGKTCSTFTSRSRTSGSANEVGGALAAHLGQELSRQHRDFGFV